MTKVLLIVLLIAVILVIGWLVARSRHDSTKALPADDHPGAVESGAATTSAAIAPPADITEPSILMSPLPPEPDPVAEPEPEPVVPQPENVEPEVVETAPAEPETVAEPFPEPEPVIEPQPPAEPEPVIEPEPPVEPEPIIEPEPPTEPEPAIQAESEPVHEAHGDPLAAEAEKPVEPPPPSETEMVRDEAELPAEELDAHAGWETDDDRTIHADPESGLYHTPDSPGYKLGPDGVVFESEDEAETAGFTRWDEPR